MRQWQKNSDQNIYVSMTHMYDNENFPSGGFGDSLQLTSWILDSGATCNMKPEILDFIPSSLE